MLEKLIEHFNKSGGVEHPSLNIKFLRAIMRAVIHDVRVKPIDEKWIWIPSNNGKREK